MGLPRVQDDILARVGGAVSLAERVPAGNQSNGLLVIHRHAGESFADIPCRGNGIRVSIRPFWIDVDQAHLNCSEGIREITIAAIALVRQPLALGPQ